MLIDKRLVTMIGCVLLVVIIVVMSKAAYTKLEDFEDDLTSDIFNDEESTTDLGL